MSLIKKIRSFFIVLYHLFIAAGKGFVEDRVMKLSAALAYYTIFSFNTFNYHYHICSKYFFGR